MQHGLTAHPKKTEQGLHVYDNTQVFWGIPTEQQGRQRLHHGRDFWKASV